MAARAAKKVIGQAMISQAKAIRATVSREYWPSVSLITYGIVISVKTGVMMIETIAAAHVAKPPVESSPGPRLPGPCM